MCNSAITIITVPLIVIFNIKVQGISVKFVGFFLGIYLNHSGFVTGLLHPVCYNVTVKNIIAFDPNNNINHRQMNLYW